MADLEVPSHENNNTNKKPTEVVADDPQLQDRRESSGKEPFGHHSELQLRDLSGNPETNINPISTQQQLETNNPNTTQQLNTSTIYDRWNVKDFKYYRPLYKAALKGDWGIAEEFFRRDPEAVNVTINGYSRTALHIAASAGHSHFAKKLVERMSPEALAFRDNYAGETALHIVSVAGMTDVAMAMVNKNKDLTQIQNIHKRTPVHLCAFLLLKHKKSMIQYLCKVTRNEEPSMPFSGYAGVQLVCNIIVAGFYDVALYVVQHYPNLATEQYDGYSVLGVLARKSSAFPSGSCLGFWQRCIYSLIPLQVDEERVHGRIVDRIVTQRNSSLIRYISSTTKGALFKFLSWTYLLQAPGIKQMYLKKLGHIQAMELLKCLCARISLMTNDDMIKFFLRTLIYHKCARYGTVELVIECLRTLPDQIWFSSKGRTMFHVAVEHRREKIFNLMYEMNAEKAILSSLIDESKNNILHMAAKLAPSPQLNIVSGAALQMQRELQWYKEVEKLGQPRFKVMCNNNGDTPSEVFTREHNDLLKEGEKWLKDTAQSCTVIAALIVTVVFTAIFTLPGGNISDTESKNNGTPLFLHKSSFMVFLISNALALFSSTTSVLMFLSILTSRYSEEDFLYALPKRIIIGLTTLFFSIATMMIAFSATLTIVLSERLKWVYFPIAATACLPVTLFALLQFPLLVEIIHSTYGPGIFQAGKNKNKLYY